MKKKLNHFSAILMGVFLLSPNLLIPADEQQEKNAGAVIKGSLVSSENVPMKDIEFFLLKVPFSSEDLKNEKKRKKLFKKAVFCPLTAQTKTDENGEFIFNEVPIGNYFLSAAITQKNVVPGTDYVKSGKDTLVIFVQEETDQFDLHIKSGKELISLKE